MSFFNSRDLYSNQAMVNYAPSGYEVYYNIEKLFAVGYSKNSKNPKFNYSFRSVERMMEYILKVLENEQKVVASKAAAKKAKAEFKHNLVVGDVLSSSWGYEQTNVDYYQVVAVKGKSVVIREIRGAMVSESAYYCGQKCPIVDSFIGDEMRKLVNEYNGVKITSFANASPVKYEMVDGKKRYESSYFSTGY